MEIFSVVLIVGAAIAIGHAVQETEEVMSDKVWIHAHVEEMRESDEYVSVPRDEWEAMSEAEQNDYCTSVAIDAMNNSGGCGAQVVDESEVPEEWLS